MTWIAHHKTSEALAARAHTHLLDNRPAEAEDLFRESAKAEMDALALIDSSKARTLGVIAVSAVALWYKAKDFAMATNLAYQSLANPAIQGTARTQLEELVQALYNERDKSRLAGHFLPGSVTVSVKGRAVLRGAAPLDLIVDKVKALQAIFFRVIELDAGKPLRRRGPPTRDITNAYEPWLVQEAPGSFQFSVAVKVSGQFDMFNPDPLVAADVAKKFLDVVSIMAVDETGEASKRLIPDDGYRGTIRKLVRSLAPASSTESIEIMSKDGDVPVVLDDSTRLRLSSAIRAESTQADASVGEEMQEHSGVLRALDLDKDWLIVDVDGTQLHVNGLSQTVDDVIGPMVNKFVFIRTVRTTRGTNRFVDIVLAPK